MAETTRRSVRAYFATLRGCERAWWIVQSALAGIWLGVFDVDTLHEVDKLYYDSKRKMYADEGWNTRGLQEWERAALEAHFGGCDRLLVSSVGGGREVIGLAAEGFAADGFECHPELRARARELAARSGLDAEIFAAERDRVPDVDRVYDGAIIGWGGYMHIVGRARRVAFLRAMRARVCDGGPILLSFFTRSEAERRYRLVTAIGNAIRFVLRRERLEIGDTLDTNYVHCFTRREIAEELRDGGFEMVAFSSSGYGRAVGRATGESAGRSSPVVARAAAPARRTA